MQCRAICQSLGNGRGIKWTRVLLRQRLEKEDICQTLTGKSYFFVGNSRQLVEGILYSLGQHVLYFGRKNEELLLLSAQRIHF